MGIFLAFKEQGFALGRFHYPFCRIVEQPIADKMKVSTRMLPLGRKDIRARLEWGNVAEASWSVAV